MRPQRFECLADCDNGTVQFWFELVVGWWAIDKVEMANNAATGLGKDYLCLISVDMQYHVTCVVSDEFIGLCCCII